MKDLKHFAVDTSGQVVAGFKDEADCSRYVKGGGGGRGAVQFTRDELGLSQELSSAIDRWQPQVSPEAITSKQRELETA